MNVQIAAIADHAWVENGCLSICRVFDTISAPQFPYQMPRLSIALRLLFKRIEAGDHKLVISLADSDGKKILNVEANVKIDASPNSPECSSFPFALNGQSIVFPKEGTYALDILVDSRVDTSVPIYVKKNNPPGVK